MAGSVHHTIRNRPSELPWIRWAAAPRLAASSGSLATRGQCGGGAPVAVAADQGVDRRILAESLDAGGEHDQFAVVGDRHAGAVHRLVAQPGAVHLRRVEPAGDPLERFVDDVDIRLLGQRGGRTECRTARRHRVALADEQAALHHRRARVLDDGEHPQDRHRRRDEAVERRVDHVADGARRRPMIRSMPATAPTKWLRWIVGSPPRPITMFLVKLAMPITSCGTT